MNPHHRFAILFLISMLIVFISMLAAARMPQVHSSKESLKIGGEVPVVENPREPAYGTLALDLEEDLSIGREEDKNYLFWLIHALQVDGKGRIYVDDARNFRIQVFNPYGAHALTIGRQGQGPGEFQQPTRLRVNDRTGRLYVRDLMPQRISIFDLRGVFLGSIPFHGVLVDYFPLDDSGIIAVMSRGSDMDLNDSQSLARMNQDGTVEKTYGAYTSNPMLERVAGGIAGSTTGYEVMLHLTPLGDGRFVYGFSKDYELTVSDRELKPLVRIRKQEDPPDFDVEEKKDRDRGYIQAFKPYFFRLLSDSRGRIYVQRNFTHNKNTVQDDIPMAVDIFGTDGRFLYRSSLPPNTSVIKDGYLYSYSIDWDEGRETVHRYRIKNWDKVRERGSGA